MQVTTGRITFDQELWAEIIISGQNDFSKQFPYRVLIELITAKFKEKKRETHFNLGMTLAEEFQ